jgi:hypothetical protein
MGDMLTTIGARSHKKNQTNGQTQRRQCTPRSKGCLRRRTMQSWRLEGSPRRALHRYSSFPHGPHCRTGLSPHEPRCHNSDFKPQIDYGEPADSPHKRRLPQPYRDSILAHPHSHCLHKPSLTTNTTHKVWTESSLNEALKRDKRHDVDNVQSGEPRSRVCPKRTRMRRQELSDDSSSKVTTHTGAPSSASAFAGYLAPKSKPASPPGLHHRRALRARSVSCMVVGGLV